MPGSGALAATSCRRRPTPLTLAIQTRSQREIRSVLRGVAIPCKTSGNIRRTNRTVIAECQLHGERLVDVVDVAHAKLDQRRRVQIDHDKVSLAFWRNGADSITDIERFGSPARREPPCRRWRKRMTA